MADTARSGDFTAEEDARTAKSVDFIAEEDVRTANSVDFEILREKFADVDVRTAESIYGSADVRTARNLDGGDVCTAAGPDAISTRSADSLPESGVLTAKLFGDDALPESGVLTAKLINSEADVRSAGWDRPESNVKTAQSFATSRTAKEISLREVLRNDQPEEGVETAKSISSEVEAIASSNPPVQELTCTSLVSEWTTSTFSSDMYTNFSETGEEDSTGGVDKECGKIYSVLSEDSVRTGVEHAELHTAIDSSVRTAIDADEIRI